MKMANHPNRGKSAREQRLQEILKNFERAGRGNEPDLRTAVHAIERYQNDARFRALADQACARAMETLPRDRYEFERRDIHRAMQEACVFLLESVLTNDAELNAMRHERDLYKQFAEESVGLRPMAPIVFAPPPPVSS